MAKLNFYPLGNADSTLIELNDGRLILKDYFKVEKNGDDDKRIDLEAELRSKLKALYRDDFDVGAFSHCDDDHCHGAENFFWLDHSTKYQGKGRIPMKEMWVPACFILEKGLSGTAEIMQAESQYRFKKGKGIRVFGNPEQLDDWLRENKIDSATRLHLIEKAGTCVRGFNQTTGNVEIFSHSPFSFRMEEDMDDRNGNSLVWHLTFFEGSRKLRCILGADAKHQTWADIVFITKLHGNDERLESDLFKISHHCSYLSLSEEKGEDETTPRDEVKELFDKTTWGCVLISSSEPIPTEDTDQPPHKYAAAFYRRVVRDKGNEDNFIVTMQWPTKDDPKPVVIETTVYGFTVQKRLAAVAGAAAVISKPSPRFG